MTTGKSMVPLKENSHGAQRMFLSNIVDEIRRVRREGYKDKTTDGREVEISAASLVNPKPTISTIPTTFAKPVGTLLFVGLDNDPKPQTPPIKDPWGHKSKMFLDEDNLARNNELRNTINKLCKMIEGRAYKKGLEEALQEFGVDIEELTLMEHFLIR